MNHADAEIFQKTGYCLQKEKRYKKLSKLIGKPMY